MKIVFMGTRGNQPQNTRDRFSVFPASSQIRVVVELDQQPEGESIYGVSGNLKLVRGRMPLGYVLFQNLIQSYRVNFWSLI